MNITRRDLLRFQKNELTSSYIYNHFAGRLKDKKNQKIMAKMAAEEGEHAQIWQKYTGVNLKPNRLKAYLYILLIYIFGYTFMMRLLEHEEYSGIKDMQKLVKKYPHIIQIIKQEEEHEKHLISMLDEDRLNYVGDMVLGLNDALVELTGTLAGLTFVLMNGTLIAMAGIITGVSATLSMVASNYLAQRADNNPKAFKASSDFLGASVFDFSIWYVFAFTCDDDCCRNSNYCVF